MKRSLLIALSLVFHSTFLILHAHAAGVTLDVNDDASALVVTVPAGCLTGSKLELAYDNTAGANAKFVPLARAVNRSDWANARTLSESVPAEGATFTVTFADLGVPADACFRLFTTDTYALLDYVWCNTANAWVDTGIKDTDVYGLELGFLPTGTTSTYPYCFGSIYGGSAGISIQHSNGSVGQINGAYLSRWTDNSYTYSDHLVFTSAMNTLVFRNNKLTFNGAEKNAIAGAKKWITSPIGPSGHNLSLNRIGDEEVAKAWTKWYYVKFYDQLGNLSLDYVPAILNNEVGFFDRANGRFVTPTGGGAFTAGNVTAEAALVSFPIGRLRSFPRLGRKPAEVTIDKTEGVTLTVKVSPGYGVGSKLYLAHGTTDGGADLAAWSDRLELDASVPAAGGTYTVDLAAQGLDTGHLFRVFAGDQYTILTRVQQDSENDGIDTGIRDHLVHSCELGHYCTGYSSQWSAYFGSGTGNGASEPGFRVCLGGNKYYVCISQLSNNLYTYKFYNLVHDVCNDFKIGNGVVTYNGTVLNPQSGSSAWTTTPIGTSGYDFYLGHLPIEVASNHGNYGWWYYLTLKDEYGRTLLDYVPVKNGGNVAGFFDRVSGRFVTPADAGGALVAGEVKTAANYVGVSLSETMAADDQLPFTATWHGGTSGDLNAAANWTCTNYFGVEIANVVPRAGITAVTFVGQLAFNVATAESIIWDRAKFLDSSLVDDCDWSGIGAMELAGTIDLAGNSLTLTDVPSAGAITSTLAGNPGELHVVVAEGATVNNANCALNGNLRFYKEGAGLFIATKNPQNYTAGNEIVAGTLKCGTLGNINLVNKYSCFGYLAVLNVRPGGTLDSAGSFWWGYQKIHLYGGTLINTIQPSEYHFNPEFYLHADSSFNVIDTSDIKVGGSVQDLGGYTLTVDVAQGKWLLVDSGLNNGTIATTGLGYFNFEHAGALDYSTVSFDFSSRFHMNCTGGVTMNNLVVRCGDGMVTGVHIAQPLRVKGRFTPVTQNFPNVQLQNGATLDLSDKNDAFAVASAVENCSLSFAANATVTIDTGSRLLTSSRLVAWPEGNPPAGADTLKAVSNRQGITLQVREDGIYCLSGIVIMFR